MTHQVDIVDNFKYPLSQLIFVAIHLLVLKGNVVYVIYGLLLSQYDKRYFYRF